MKPKEDNIPVANYLIEYIKATGLMKQELADKLGISRQALHKMLTSIEQDGGTIQGNAKIARAIGLEMWEIFVSPDEAKLLKELKKSQSNVLRCPHCGKALSITIA